MKKFLLLIMIISFACCSVNRKQAKPKKVRKRYYLSYEIVYSNGR